MAFSEEKAASPLPLMWLVPMRKRMSEEVVNFLSHHVAHRFCLFKFNLIATIPRARDCFKSFIFIKSILVRRSDFPHLMEAAAEAQRG